MGWGAAIGSIASAAGSFFGQQSANQANANLNSANMAFQQKMRDTAMQSRVNDLKAAGLNPILAAGSLGGAAQPGFSPIPMQNSFGPSAAQGVAGAVGTALDASIKAAQAKNIDADTDNKKGVVGTPGHAQAYQAIATAQSLEAGTALAKQQTINAVQDLASKKLDLAAKSVAYEQAVEVMPAMVDLAKTQAALLKLGVPAAQAQSNMMSGPAGKYIPYFDEAIKALGIGAGFTALIKSFLSGPGRPPGPSSTGAPWAYPPIGGPP